MPTTLNDLLDALRKYRLLEPEQLQDLAARIKGKSVEPAALGQKLIQQGWLTAYQVKHLLQGLGESLVLGQYILLEHLGAGGMGEVFKARHITMDRTVAIKLIRKERLEDNEAVKRFHREIRAAAQLAHPNVVRAFDADQVGGTHIFVMEFIEGMDLARLVKDKGPLPVAQACDHIRQAALGLQHAHEKGMVHRDIKPHNLLLARNRTVKILDLGLARFARPDSAEASSTTLTREGSVMGTLDYIAPEQAMDSHTVDIRADLYSLGCTIYFLLTGKVPFPGGDALAKLMKHKQAEPVPVEQLRPDVPPGVAAVVRKLMAKQPEDRYQTPAEVAAVLGEPAALAAGGSHVPQRPPLPAASAPAGSFAAITSTVAVPVVPRRAPRRRRLVRTAAAGAALLTLLGVFGFLIFSGPGTDTGTEKITNPDRVVGVKTSNPAPLSPDRVAAEWIVANGSWVAIFVDDKQVPVNAVAEIPNNPFEVRQINVNRNWRANDKTLMCLQGLRHLETAQITNCPVTDKTLTYLKDAKRLRVLLLYATGVSDAGLPLLEGFGHLEYLNLRQTAVTASAVKKLAVVLPKCKIDWSGGVVDPAK